MRTSGVSKRRVVTIATTDAHEVNLDMSFLGVVMQYSGYVLDKS